MGAGGTGPAAGSPGYEDAGPLRARLALYSWQRDRLDLPGLALAALSGTAGVVLDVGCGPGVYARRLAAERPDLRVATLDLSPGMRPRVVGDVVRLPFATACADGVLAMHMLYHAGDVPAAVAELRRVLRPGGVLVVSTNSPDDKPELGRLISAAAASLGGGGTPFASPSEAFSAADGDVLAAEFDHVERVVHERVVEVPEAAPVVAYADSLRAWYEPALPPDVTWAALVSAVRERVERVLEADGVFRLTSGPAVFTCR